MPSNVILVGFMGAGKSSVGRILARRLGRCFVETDEMIVAKEGVSIPEIFAAKGEPSKGLVDEAEQFKAVIAAALKDPRVDAKRVVLAGKSLGSVVAHRAFARLRLADRNARAQQTHGRPCFPKRRSLR